MKDKSFTIGAINSHLPIFFATRPKAFHVE
jgi:hypothetical protein